MSIGVIESVTLGAVRRCGMHSNYEYGGPCFSVAPVGWLELMRQSTQKGVAGNPGR